MKRLEGRIRYVSNWHDEGEFYLFETRRDGEWELETAFPIVDDAISYRALVRVREWMRMGIFFYFDTSNDAIEYALNIKDLI